MAMIRLIENCYLELEEIRNKIINQKQKEGKPTKTTYSEIINLLIRNYKKHDVAIQ
ncbi:MAG: hypothetical protein OIN86_04675 [Candidatus Methanoperedens sp.]|nr:hypothetical protein [Candidatus Methanoperedens sp.]CAG0996767.1 hypothetical protein METP1_02618 [Methanosarcinales archaeon]